MYKKILIFGDFISSSGAVFLKSAATMRLSYKLRQLGYNVKQVHHCTSFNKDELKTIVDEFSNNEPVLICVSTSFLSSLKRKNALYADLLEKHKSKGAFWGDRSFLFLINIGKICKEKGFPYLLGGWEVSEDKMINSNHQWGFEILNMFVTYYVTGKDIDVIERICKDEPVTFETIRGSKVAKSAELVDFSDCASTPVLDDHIAHGESLVSEIAAGCIFSCSFCNYAALGKKKNEYLRTFESLEAEIVENYKNFGTTLYTLTDNIINDYPEKLRYMIRIREKYGIDLRWVGYARLDTIKTKEHAQMLKDSGMIGASFGIESFNKETGKYIGKMTEKSRLIDSLGMLRDAIGDTALVSGLFIAGLPMETKETLHETYEWLNSNEGRYYIDSFIFTRLMIEIENNDKNEINKSRNNPFRDYEFRGKYKWTSPWGTVEEYTALAYKYNANKKNPLVTSFTLPYYNNIGYDPVELVKLTRKVASEGGAMNIGDHYDFRPNHTKYINQYKDKVLRV